MYRLAWMKTFQYHSWSNLDPWWCLFWIMKDWPHEFGVWPLTTLHPDWTKCYLVYIACRCLDPSHTLRELPTIRADKTSFRSSPTRICAWKKEVLPNEWSPPRLEQNSVLVGDVIRAPTGPTAQDLSVFRPFRASKASRIPQIGGTDSSRHFTILPTCQITSTHLPNFEVSWNL